MFLKLVWLAAFSTLFLPSQCHNPGGRPGHGLIGYGIPMYFPTCCTACRDILSASPLNCSHILTAEELAVSDDGDLFETEPDCFATDDTFLLSLAACINQHCPVDPQIGAELKTWQVEEWWQLNVVGRQTVQPDPKFTYQQALARLTVMPNNTLITGDPLNATMLVSEDDYQTSLNADTGFETAEDTHSRYSLVVFLSGVMIPIGLSLLRFLPFPSRWATIFNAWVIDPPAIGAHHKVPILWGLTQMPTRGQALFISYLTIINIVLSGVGYTAYQPNGWFSTPGAELLTYLTNRVGCLSFANVPLLILYAGRNNFLLWLTNWRHDTFVLVHRYIATIATLQAVLHSVIYLQIKVAAGTYSMDSMMAYWIWGAVATVAMSLLLPASILPFRRVMYEVFLLLHIVISISVVVGCYLHIQKRFDHQWGYELWIYIAMAVWGFDRLVRLGRVAYNGLRWARVSAIDDDYVRVDIEGVTGNGHAYLYFPTLTWRFWENHPFSVASAVQYRAKPITSSSQEISSAKDDVEKMPNHSVTELGSGSDDDSVRTPSQAPRLTLTFLLRTRGGLTSLLRSCSRVPVFVESSYGARSNLFEHGSLICIAGGVGVTALLPLLRSHVGRNRLLWGVRSTGIVEAMSAELTGVDKDVFVGHRMNIREELEKELSFSNSAVVAVSGPDGMADEVRNAVCDISRHRKVTVQLIEESFSW